MASHYFQIYLLALSLLFGGSCSKQISPTGNSSYTIQKINGVNFSGPPRPPLERDMIEGIKASNADWVAFIPEATTFRQNLQVEFDPDRGWWSENTEANVQSIQIAKEIGLKVMLKPHMVIGYDMSELRRDGTFSRENRAAWREKVMTYIQDQPDLTDSATWRGDFIPKDQEHIPQWEAEYTGYILHHAKIADSLAVDMFCIGTELSKMANARPEFWRRLIQEVRSIYKGPLTYSANWDNYSKIAFWDELDFIGVNAYFPLSEEKQPSIKQNKAAWVPYVKAIKALGKQFQKPVLFTEYGYRNIEYNSKAPWESGRANVTINQQAQADALEALYQVFWDEEWFAGGFLWKWFHRPQREGNSNFSPQGKPALEVVSKYYGLAND